jgi:hypothetical protein
LKGCSSFPNLKFKCLGKIPIIPWHTLVQCPHVHFYLGISYWQLLPDLQRSWLCSGWRVPICSDAQGWALGLTGKPTSCHSPHYWPYAKFLSLLLLLPLSTTITTLIWIQSPGLATLFATHESLTHVY